MHVKRCLCRGLLLIGLLAVWPAGGRAAETDAPGAFNYILGTQTFSPTYQFTTNTRLVETAAAIRELGATVIKFEVSSRYAAACRYVPAPRPGVDSLRALVRDEPSYRRVLELPFAHYVLWAHTFCGDRASWREGFPPAAQEREYRELYDLAVYLLRTYSGSGKTFYLGHWEGDGWLRGSVARENDARVTPAAVQGMIDWLGARQRAVEDARRDTPHAGVAVWHYTEVNHVKLALEEGRPALVNTVLPKVPVDYVSYSCYDTQKDAAGLRAALDYIESQLVPKAAPAGKRVFIGEYGFPACWHKPAEQDALSRQVIRTGLAWGCPFILYWELYNNEVEANGRHRGFWLIDDQGVKQPVYHTHQRYFAWARQRVADSLRATGRPPAEADFRRAALDFLAAPAP